MSSELLMQTATDVARIFGHGPLADCRPLDNGCIALSGQPAADLNMVFLTAAARQDEFDDALTAIRDKGVDAILVVEENADEVRRMASNAGLTEVGQMPIMERRASALKPSPKHTVRLASPDETSVGNQLAAAAFSLNPATCDAAVPAAAMEQAGTDLWLAEEDGKPVGSGTFVRSGEHVGVYSMGTPPANQGRGVGRAILESAMAYYQDSGVTRFTLGATEKGFPLYERVGFETRSLPHVYVVGASTQFPGA